MLITIVSNDLKLSCINYNLSQIEQVSVSHGMILMDVILRFYGKCQNI